MRRVLVLLILLLPPAAADHVYSHRFVVEGRLIGANGLPLRGVLVDVSAEGESLLEPCQELQRPVTDAWGDFRYCYHRHEVGPGGVVTVRAGNASQSRPLDADLRRMVFYLRDANASGEAPEGWDRTFEVGGRVWERGWTRLDGVNVSGLALAGVPVQVSNVNATRAEGDLEKGSTFNLTTDGFGDYGVVVRLFEGERPEDIVVTVRAQGAAREARLVTAFHRLTLDFALPFEVAAAPDLSAVPRPGSASGPVSAWMLLAVGLALLGAVGLARRRA